ncbi:fumarylacetoacetate hydrolase family protein [Lentisphaerota bacterium ZTH]|nr:fumarylacetoacetate hydrolase family protein [Lentisphaerota bacterium]WET06696.1 fumarylacetoacetate hydrolase family protein [Lentisphaerota bacterium ZTH]
MQINLNDQNFEIKRIFCIGQNYVKHIAELKNKVPQEPVVFMKPLTSLVPAGGKAVLPKLDCNIHYETEIVALIGKRGRPESVSEAREYIAGITVGFDLTIRDLQTKLRSKGLPWEKTKAFDCSAPLGKFASVSPDYDLDNMVFSGSVNGNIVQQGNSADMIFDIPTLLIELGKYWELLPGDLLFTGTPEGVGSLTPGDSLCARSPNGEIFNWQTG